ncbi:MAG TPA: ribbon-helix-helix protein, CopG family [Thermoanaerobaculia bacterium]|nr:ribbon-helix-helix protein, CopG family [Thermoanaerobaculia bacterium]
MIRTIISLDDEDKAWLDRRAEEERVTMTQLVRMAIRRYRQELEAGAPSFERQLQATAGLWRGEDGLEHQRRLRAEWDEREE